MAAMSIELGRIIGDYEVMDRLGAGGIGEVYKVRHLISQRVEAMKLLRADRTGGELPERFLREIRVLAMLSHQSIARLLNAFKVGDQIAMVMEYIEGEDLHARLRAEWPGRAAEGTEYIRQVLSALQYAHSRNVVHRDIKPSNIMITAEGHAKLLDFGIAFQATEDNSLTKPGSMVGSLPYMCPEQIRGERVDARSDLYSLGVTLYEIVTGRRPFDGNTEFEVMAAHLQQMPKWPGDIDPAIPYGLSQALMRALAKDPAARFQNAAEFLDALNLSREDFATLHALSINPAVYSLAPVARGGANTPVSHVKSNAANTPVSHVKSTMAGGFGTPTARAGTPSESGVVKSDAAQFDAALLDSMVRELATFIGPIAKVVVKRAAQGCSSVDDLYSTVAKEIDSEKDRAKFLGAKKRPSTALGASSRDKK
jgi:serine/threonine-protein kinase